MTPESYLQERALLVCLFCTTQLLLCQCDSYNETIEHGEM